MKTARNAMTADLTVAALRDVAISITGFLLFQNSGRRQENTRFKKRNRRNRPLAKFGRIPNSPNLHILAGLNFPNSIEYRGARRLRSSWIYTGLWDSRGM